MRSKGYSSLLVCLSVHFGLAQSYVIFCIGRLHNTQMIPHGMDFRDKPLLVRRKKENLGFFVVYVQGAASTWLTYLHPGTPEPKSARRNLRCREMCKHKNLIKLMNIQIERPHSLMSMIFVDN